ncbi:ADP-forming succinate--CoA ligase subunit beta [bacterium]|nr:ADP-forming succinate--CoA ligase subunit beta [Chloroflexi bacterium CFX6]RIL10237.1 MAG: ADP-forming succinate--CoA ligase subunit beta [bacterium]
MNIHEYQAKRLFGRFGIPVPAGEVATTPAEARAVAERIGGRVVVKAQVLTGGRGKAGGVKLADGPEAVEARAREILGMDIKGHTVHQVLVDPAVAIASEIYLAAVLDRGQRRTTIMTSRQGGVDIEEVAATDPSAIKRVTIDPLVGLQPFHGRRLAYGIGLGGAQAGQFGRIVAQLYQAYQSLDATLAEINPLVVLADGTLMALDGKVNLDDSALFRQPELEALRDPGEETEAERMAREAGLNYVDLDGSIGCLVNGAGLAMATMDVTQLCGGSPANFLDIGGGAQADKVETAMRIILRDPRVKSVLVNIFGGITRGDEVARGILAALGNIDTDVPFVVRIVGTNAAEARAILAGADMRTAPTLYEAAQMAVAAAAGR